MSGEDERVYHVVVNHEEQYSIWQTDLEMPQGWTATGFSGPKDACLAHIAEVWTDMRPLSLRRALAASSER
ncbi:MbtH protein [Streptosporangium becharense]|uniref:MbtH protein n=1 Tax=Streptosporangium becharense TaxID=1816182 RepID=A0A7W9ILU7_9ACTN|nr:MbtH family NRPS accessory protein [Streptosporangium becharense]MBB2910385.1 MbtH protein [Streptosporangium becharense]MBB5823128.1 MbtH protein [Streptosporangium becharense]